MKKKLISAFLAAALVLSMFPASVWAEGDVRQESGSGALTEAEVQQDGGADAAAEAEAQQVSTQEELKAAIAKGGEIQLTADITITAEKAKDGKVVFPVSKDTVLDLNGCTLCYTMKDSYSDLIMNEIFLQVGEGASLTVDDSKTGGRIIVEETADGDKRDINGDNKEDYVLIGVGVACVDVRPGGSFTLENGTLENAQPTHEATEVISNFGETTINGGKVTGVTCISNTAPARIKEEGKAVCTVNGGEITGKTCKYYQGKEQTSGWSYGIGLFGAGVPNGDLSQVDNDLVTLNVNGGKIVAENGQGIGTNASSGRYAGNTINISGGLVSGGEAGTGMYLPAIGVTNIRGGTVYGAQAVRICAGTLNISGDATITGTASSNGEDILAGGSGGTTGAIVVGKASNGYVGDLEVNISGEATIENTSNNSDQPAIVVSDKHMAESGSQKINDPSGKPIDGSSFSYTNTSIRINMDGSEGAKVDGDVIKISNVTQEDEDESTDGGNVTLNLTETTVTGSLVNRSTSTDIVMDGGSVKNVENNNAGSIFISNAKITGTVENLSNGESEGEITIVGCTVPDTVKTDEENNITVVEDIGTNEIYCTSDGKIYEDIAKALAALKENGTLYLGEGTFTVTANNALIVEKDNVTIRGIDDDPAKTIIDASTTNVREQAGFYVSANNVTIENLTIRAGVPAVKTTDALKFSDGNTLYEILNKGTVRNVILSSETGHGLNIHGVNGMVVDGLTVEEAGKLSISVANSPEVTISNTTTASTTWGSGRWDIGVMYKAGQETYANPSHILIGDGNTFTNGGLFYSGRPLADKDSFSLLDPDKEIYQMMGEDAPIPVYTTKIPPAAIKVEDGNDLYYESFEEALKAAKDGNTIKLNEEVGGPVTIDKDVTIDGSQLEPYQKGDESVSGSFSNTVTITNSGVSIKKTDLTDADIVVETEGEGTVDLSENYWGGDEPDDIEGAKVYPYYDEPEMGKEDLKDEEGEVTRPSRGDSEPSKGRPLPLRGDTSPAFESDTTYDLTVNDVYQFRITSLDGHTPAMTLGNGNFRVELASRSGNDYFFKVYVQGNAESTCGVFVDGQYLLTLTVGGSAVISDTTAPFTVAQGGTYQFKLTAAQRPAFAAGSPCFTVEYAGNSGNDWFYKVHAVGEAGESSGFYINGSASPVAVASIG